LDDKLKLSIKPRKENPTKSADYQMKVNDWELAKGVRKVTLDMDAPEKPTLIIECHPDIIEIDDVAVDAVFKDHSENRNVEKSIEIVDKKTKELIASIGENDVIIHDDYEVIESENKE
jgi:hypothetical protein